MSWTRALEIQRRAVALERRNELASGARLGGKFDGPRDSTSALWKGRPPQLEDGIGPMTLSIAALPDDADLGQTVTVEIEAGNAWGGQITRLFNVGGALSADLRVGDFEHVVARVVRDPLAAAGQGGIPNGMSVYFCWTWELQPTAALMRFLDYPAGAIGTNIALPEGCTHIHVQNAGNLTFAWSEYAGTFVRPVLAGERVPCVGPTFSCNVANVFVFESRGL